MPYILMKNYTQFFFVDLLVITSQICLGDQEKLQMELNTLRQEVGSQVQQINLLKGELETIRRKETETLSQLENIKQAKVLFLQ